MSLINIAQGEVVTVRVYKLFGGYLWANNYEMQAVNNLSDPSSALQELADNLVTLERALHLTDITIDRVTISTYAPDSQPYNPDNLATFPYNQFGQRTYSGDALPLDACLFIRRNTNFGRDGRLFYRGCLSEADVGTRGFRGVLTSSSQATIRNIVTNWYQTGLSPQWRFVMASGNPNPTSIRGVIALDPSERVVYKKLNNRYFRRRP
jgi:hypothetical protein